jgi:hypothetical protein
VPDLIALSTEECVLLLAVGCGQLLAVTTDFAGLDRLSNRIPQTLYERLRSKAENNSVSRHQLLIPVNQVLTLIILRLFLLETWPLKC